MANIDNGFIPEVGMVFFAEKKPMMVDEYTVYDHARGKLVTLNHHKFDHNHRAVMWRCMSMDKYIMVGTQVGSTGARVAFVLKDWSYFPISPTVLADMGLGVDGFPAPAITPAIEESSEQKVTEGT